MHVFVTECFDSLKSIASAVNDRKIVQVVFGIVIEFQNSMVT